MIKLARMAWEQFSLYLPVILMGVLALATYWLVRSTPLLMPLQQESTVRHESDYFMHKFSVKTFAANGHLKSQVAGAQARHYPDTDTLEIDFVQIRSFSAEGTLTAATANHALINGDASEVQLFGAARVLREATLSQSGQPEARLEFLGESLHAFMTTERIKSELPVQLTRGKDHFTADALDFDQQERVILLKGHVKGLLVPEVK